MCRQCSLLGRHWRGLVDYARDATCQFVSVRVARHKVDDGPRFEMRPAIVTVAAQAYFVHSAHPKRSARPSREQTPLEAHHAPGARQFDLELISFRWPERAARSPARKARGLRLARALASWGRGDARILRSGERR